MVSHATARARSPGSQAWPTAATSPRHKNAQEALRTPSDRQGRVGGVGTNGSLDVAGQCDRSRSAVERESLEGRDEAGGGQIGGGRGLADGSPVDAVQFQAPEPAVLDEGGEGLDPGGGRIRPRLVRAGRARVGREGHDAAGAPVEERERLAAQECDVGTGRPGRAAAAPGNARLGPGECGTVGLGRVGGGEDEGMRVRVLPVALALVLGIGPGRRARPAVARPRPATRTAPRRDPRRSSRGARDRRPPSLAARGTPRRSRRAPLRRGRLRGSRRRSARGAGAPALPRARSRSEKARGAKRRATSGRQLRAGRGARSVRAGAGLVVHAGGPTAARAAG